MDTANKQYDAIVETVRRLPVALEDYREMLLANLVMIGEIPAPTFGEDQRIEFLKQRFTECGLQNVSSDEMGNGVAILPGSSKSKSILVAARADTPFSATTDHTISLDVKRVVGAGVAGSSLGLAVLATLPTMLERLDIKLCSSLVLMGATRSLGRGNLGGLRFFLSHNQLPLVAGITVNGTQLGNLHHVALASVGGEIRCRVAESDATTGAIDLLNEVINRLRAIELPAATHTALVLGEVEGGTSFKLPARTARLRFRVRSESDAAVAQITKEIDTLVEALSETSGSEVSFEVIAQANAGGIADDHPLVLQARRVMTSLGITPGVGCCSSSVSSFTERDIPAISIGITEGRNLSLPDEEISTNLMLRGVAQLIGILMAVDGGCCD